MLDLVLYICVARTLWGTTALHPYSLIWQTTSSNKHTLLWCTRLHLYAAPTSHPLGQDRGYLSHPGQWLFSPSSYVQLNPKCWHSKGCNSKWVWYPQISPTQPHVSCGKQSKLLTEFDIIKYKSVVPWASAGVWVCTLKAPPSGIHKTALRVQNPCTRRSPWYNYYMYHYLTLIEICASFIHKILHVLLRLTMQFVFHYYIWPNRSLLDIECSTRIVSLGYNNSYRLLTGKKSTNSLYVQ